MNLKYLLLSACCILLFACTKKTNDPIKPLPVTKYKIASVNCTSKSYVSNGILATVGDTFSFAYNDNELKKIVRSNATPGLFYKEPTTGFVLSNHHNPIIGGAVLTCKGANFGDYEQTVGAQLIHYDTIALDKDQNLVYWFQCMAYSSNLGVKIGRFAQYDFNYQNGSILSLDMNSDTSIPYVLPFEKGLSSFIWNDGDLMKVKSSVNFKEITFEYYTDKAYQAADYTSLKAFTIMGQPLYKTKHLVKQIVDGNGNPILIKYNFDEFGNISEITTDGAVQEHWAITYTAYQE